MISLLKIAIMILSFLGLMTLEDIRSGHVGKIYPVPDTLVVHSPVLTLLGASTELKSMPSHRKIMLYIYLVRSESNYSEFDNVKHTLLYNLNNNRGTFLDQMFTHLKVDFNSRKSAIFLFRCNDFITTLIMLRNDVATLDRLFPFEEEFLILDKILFLICNKNYPEDNEM